MASTSDPIETMKPTTQKRLPKLSPTQIRVCELAARGLTNKGIGGELGISAHTVDAHWRNVFARLGTHSRMQAVLLVELDKASREHGRREAVTAGTSDAGLV